MHQAARSRPVIQSELSAADWYRAGLELFAWVVHTADEMTDAIERGARGIIADDLDMLAGLRHARDTKGLV